MIHVFVLFRWLQELQSTRAQLFDSEQELSVSKTRADFALELQGQVTTLMLYHHWPLNCCPDDQLHPRQIRFTIVSRTCIMLSYRCAQIARLNKELVLMGELQQKYQQRLGSVTSSQNSKQEKQFLLDSYKQELSSTYTL